MRAGLDIARLWLDGPSTVFNVEGRTEPDGQVHIMQVGVHLSVCSGLICHVSGSCIPHAYPVSVVI